jgi:hypothetical protein
MNVGSEEKTAVQMRATCGAPRVTRLSALQVAQLQVETGLGATTIRKWARGERVTAPVLMALARASKKLAIPVLR